MSARSVTMVYMRSGRVLCRQGEVAEQCFIIVEGRADVFIDTRGSQLDAVISSASSLLLADRGWRTATVVATSDMSLLVGCSRRRVQTARVGLADRASHRVLRGAGRAASSRKSAGPRRRCQ